MNEQRQDLPFKSLGDRLKTIRQKLQESVADVSGAVEIDIQDLERIEQGADRPSQDILMLLISHFGMHDDEAAGLWQLAGYDQPPSRDERDNDDDTDSTPGNRAAVLIMAVDPRVIYSDKVQVHANNGGVIVNFSQSSADSQQGMTTARIGMSRDQARAVIRTMQTALDASEPRQLPSPRKDEAETQKDQQ